MGSDLDHFGRFVVLFSAARGRHQSNTSIFGAYLYYIMVISWLYQGYIMVISWLYLGYILVISWLHHGYILVISWLYLGYIMDFEEKIYRNENLAIALLVTLRKFKGIKIQEEYKGNTRRIQ